MSIIREIFIKVKVWKGINLCIHLKNNKNFEFFEIKKAKIWEKKLVNNIIKFKVFIKLEKSKIIAYKAKKLDFLAFFLKILT